jgi:NADH-quinone oxidoreductase subunit N
MDFLLLNLIYPRLDVVEIFNLNLYMDFSLLHQNFFKMFLPEVFLATSILILTLYASLVATSKKLGYPLLMKSLGKISLLVLLLTLLIVNNNSINFMIVYQNTFIFDLLTSNVKQILLAATIFCLIISEDTLVRQQINNFEYFILILCAILGLMLLVSSYDMISLYLAIELQSLCLYVLAASKKNSSFSTEAGLKYFILGSFSSALLLFGISVLYGCTGTTNFDNFYLLFSGIDRETFLLTAPVEKALIFIAAAFFFKIAAAPFHMWSPDVYEGSPTSSTIFFAVIPKIAIFAVFLRLFQTIFSSFEETFLFALIFFSISSVIVGSFVALRQKKLKRLLAYSSISHVGYMLLAFSANSLEGTQSLFFYLIVYMITSVCIWSVVLSLNTTTNMERSKTLIDLASVSNFNPMLGFTAMLAFFSLAGVPPLVGFFAKMEIFVSALGSSLFFASLIAILSSVISSYYYIRLIKTMYFEKREDNSFVFSVTYPCAFAMGLASFFLLYLFLNPTLLLLLTQKMALCLF